MLKSFNLMPVLLILTLSILTPSSVFLTNPNLVDNIIQGDFNEEEGEGNHEKDIEDIDAEESEDEKKESFFTSLIGLHNTVLADIDPASIFLVEGMSAYTSEIQLRPPEYLI